MNVVKLVCNRLQVIVHMHTLIKIPPLKYVNSVSVSIKNDVIIKVSQKRKILAFQKLTMTTMSYYETYSYVV